MFKIYGEVFIKNLKIFLFPASFAVILLMVILFAISDLRNRGGEIAAIFCQQFFSWAGIFLLSPVFMPEKRDNIEETVLSKALPIKIVYIIRLAGALFALIIFTAVFIFLLSLLGNELEFGRYFVHTLATALFLGSLAFAGTRFSGNVGVGYLIAFGVYIMQMFIPSMQINKTENLYIFTLLGEVNNVVYIYMCAFILILVALSKKELNTIF